ncbi:MAG: FtsQ-type POTRA domain-containing protein [Clostridia bacterium]|nr:FtsQ-type POTRA domain-containing protein [Clostridia bacterium]
MDKKAKEKVNSRDTKENILNLDNEIVIGIKTLPKPKVEKSKKKQTKKSKKQVNSKKKQTTHQRKKQNLKDKDTKEFELSLGIEDETIKRKKTTKKITKKEQEAIQKKRKKVFRIVKYVMLLTILLGGGIYFMLSPFFNIKEITATGNTKITSEELISLSQIQLEENTFKIQKKQAETFIKKNAYVDTVYIKRRLPNKIEIQIIERTPSFMLTLGNAYVYMNNQGYLLEVSSKAIDKPIITGYITAKENIQVGNRLEEEDLQKLEHVLQIMHSAQSNEIQKTITKIDITDKQDYILELKSEKKTVHIGNNSNLSTKMLYVKKILEEEKGIEGEILVNTDLNNKGAIFRKKI